MTLIAHEVNFDAIVGPTHNYAGLAVGNLASARSKQAASNPRAAALQGLAKMKFLMELGIKQAVLPPQLRPDVRALRRLGFSGDDARVIETAGREAPRLLTACGSASSMWAANAATVCPSADSADGRVHFTPANLVSHFHRSLETAATAAVLREIFADPRYFVHHPPLPASARFGDEGAANHTRLTMDYGQAGVQMFVHGPQTKGSQTKGSQTKGSGVFDNTQGSGVFDSKTPEKTPDPFIFSAAKNLPDIFAGVPHAFAGVPDTFAGVDKTCAGADDAFTGAVAGSRFAARQTLEGSQAVARLHQLRPEAVTFVEQNPAAIDAGVFHSDVIAVGNLDVLFFHELAFTQQADVAALGERFARQCGGELRTVVVSAAQVPLADAVGSYLFNSQLVRLPDGVTALIAPVECRENDRVRRFIESNLGPGSPIESVRYVDVRQSMNNGGGPACLRLRVVLTDAELAAVKPSVLLDETLYQRLVGWVERHYRQALAPADLADPRLLDEGRSALAELATILDLRSIAEF